MRHQGFESYMPKSVEVYLARSATVRRLFNIKTLRILRSKYSEWTSIQEVPQYQEYANLTSKVINRWRSVPSGLTMRSYTGHNFVSAHKVCAFRKRRSMGPRIYLGSSSPFQKRLNGFLPGWRSTTDENPFLTDKGFTLANSRLISKSANNTEWSRETQTHLMIKGAWQTKPQ